MNASVCYWIGDDVSWFIQRLRHIDEGENRVTYGGGGYISEELIVVLDRSDLH
jgi:hypothetical protein